MSLRAFKNSCDTVAAADIADVRRWYVEDEKMIGPEDFDAEEWDELDPEDPLTVVYLPHDYEALERKPQDVDLMIVQSERYPGYIEITSTVADWIQATGRGMICSTEW